MSSLWKERLNYIWETKVLADCEFVVRGQVVKAHKVIVATGSTVLLEKLHRSNSIVIDDMESGVFEKMLKYIYTETVDISSADVAFKLVVATRTYRVQKLEIDCYEYIINDLKPQNVLRGYYQLALQVGNRMLIEECESLIKIATREVLRDPSFLEANIDTVGAIFALESLEIDSEVELLKAADRYVKHFKAKFKADCDPTKVRSVLTKIRFLTLTPQQFAEGTVGTSILPVRDSWAIIANIASDETGLPPMPEGFCTRTDLRKIKPRQGRTAIFQFNIIEAMKFPSGYTSPEFIVQDLPWRVGMWIPNLGSSDCLLCSVVCNADDRRSWSCKAEVTLTLMRGEMVPYSRTRETKFGNDDSVRSNLRFAKLEDILNATNNYLSSGGVLTLEVTVKAERPVYS